MSKTKVTFTCKWNTNGFRCNRRVSETDGQYDDPLFMRLYNAQICESHIKEYDRRVIELKRVKNLMKVPTYSTKVRHIA